MGELELEEEEKREGEREENGEKRALSYWPVSHTHIAEGREGTYIKGIGLTLTLLRMDTQKSAQCG